MMVFSKRDTSVLPVCPSVIPFVWTFVYLIETNSVRPKHFELLLTNRKTYAHNCPFTFKYKSRPGQFCSGFEGVIFFNATLNEFLLLDIVKKNA